MPAYGGTDYASGGVYSDAACTWTVWNGVDSCSVTDVATCTTTNSANVWIQWSTSSDSGWVNRPATPETAKQKAAREAQEEARRLERAERQAREKAAKDRARELLLQNLTAEQREQFKKNGWFIVQGGKSKKLYKLHSDRWSMSVHELRAANDNRPAAELCAHTPHGACPMEDNLLVQKLMLEAAEDEFLRIANIRRVA